MVHCPLPAIIDTALPGSAHRTITEPPNAIPPGFQDPRAVRSFADYLPHLARRGAIAHNQPCAQALSTEGRRGGLPGRPSRELHSLRQDYPGFTPGKPQPAKVSILWMLSTMTGFRSVVFLRAPWPAHVCDVWTLSGWMVRSADMVPRIRTVIDCLVPLDARGAKMDQEK